MFKGKEVRLFIFFGNATVSSFPVVLILLGGIYDVPPAYPRRLDTIDGCLYAWFHSVPGAQLENRSTTGRHHRSLAPTDLYAWMRGNEPARGLAAMVEFCKPASRDPGCRTFPLEIYPGVSPSGRFHSRTFSLPILRHPDIPPSFLCHKQGTCILCRVAGQEGTS